jgi:hypothetical protein
MQSSGFQRAKEAGVNAVRKTASTFFSTKLVHDDVSGRNKQWRWTGTRIMQPHWAWILLRGMSWMFCSVVLSDLSELLVVVDAGNPVRPPRAPRCWRNKTLYRTHTVLDLDDACRLKPPASMIANKRSLDSTSITRLGRCRSHYKNRSKRSVAIRWSRWQRGQPWITPIVKSSHRQTVRTATALNMTQRGAKTRQNVNVGQAYARLDSRGLLGWAYARRGIRWLVRLMLILFHVVCNTNTEL